MTRGKKISGIKVHLGVDTAGLPHTLEVTSADVPDRDGAFEALKTHIEKLGRVVKVLCDGGYSGEKFIEKVKRLIEKAQVEIVKRNELHSFVVIPKRWVVERSFAWLEKYRRLWKNCERKLHTTLQMITLAFISILLKRF